MKGTKKNRIIITLSCVFAIITSFVLIGNFALAGSKPVVSIDYISNCTEGDTISFDFYISGENIVKTSINNEMIALNGFRADIRVSGSGTHLYGGNTNKYTVNLSNITGAGSDKRVDVLEGAATSSDNESTATSSRAISNTFTILDNDTEAPSLSLIGPSASNVKNGSTISFIARYTDNVGVSEVSLSSESISLNGFTADVIVSGSGANQKTVERTITLRNIQGNSGSSKSITVWGSTARDNKGNNANYINSNAFSIIATTNNNTGSKNTNTSTNVSKPNLSNSNISTAASDSENKVATTDDKEKVDTNTTGKPDDWIPNPETGIYKDER